MSVRPCWPGALSNNSADGCRRSWTPPSFGASCSVSRMLAPIWRLYGPGPSRPTVVGWLAARRSGRPMRGTRRGASPWFARIPMRPGTVASHAWRSPWTLRVSTSDPCARSPVSRSSTRCFSTRSSSPRTSSSAASIRVGRWPIPRLSTNGVSGSPSRNRSSTRSIWRIWLRWLPEADGSESQPSTTPWSTFWSL